METLIQREGGIPFLAPSVKERAVDDNHVALRFLQQLEAGDFDIVICMTAVGLTFLSDVIAKEMPVERLSAALRKVTIVSRGPKPVGVLRTLGVPVGIMIPEPNTWKEIVEAIPTGKPLRIAVQEYGRPNLEMNAALERLGASITPVALYRWELPDDLEPLRDAARGINAGAYDVVLFTSSIQLDHLLEVARTLGIEQGVREALNRTIAIGSIGPVMTASLEAQGLPADIIPRHPKMWSLVKAAGEIAPQVLSSTKRRAAPDPSS